MPPPLRTFAAAAFARLAVKPATALRESLAAGYGAADLRADVMAGIVVGVVALPLSMALAIASGVPPQHGLYTAIVAGVVAALLGGSRFQVTGPTAAFVVLLVPVAAKFGVAGLLVASFMAGVVLILFGVMRLGRLIQFIPYPVTTGFTAGIAVVIAVLQVKDLLGLTVEGGAEHFLDRAGELVRALPTVRPWEVALGVITLAILLGWTRITRRIPAALVALTAAAVLAVVLENAVPGLRIETIGRRFHYIVEGAVRPGIPALPPVPVLPWHLPGADGAPFLLDVATLRALLPAAFAIAVLGAIESLLSAVVADGMTGTRHDPDAELLALGTANMVAPFFGGFAATGALARTATNIRSGARSPLAAVVHSLFVLAAVLVLAPLVSYLPMASLAALLLLIAWNMSEFRHVVHLVRVAPKSDILVLLTTFSLTVLFDMTLSVSVGVVLAALLFMRRMAEISGATLVGEGHPSLREPLPEGAVLYEVGGPLFFGAAGKAMRALDNLAGKARVVILDMEDVPAMDATGLVAMEEALAKLAARGVTVVLAGVQGQPAKVLAKAGIRPVEGRLLFVSGPEMAVGVARRILAAP